MAIRARCSGQRQKPPYGTMNLDVETIALSQIQYLVTSLSKKSYKSAYSECIEIINRFAHNSTKSSRNFNCEAEKHLIRCLFAQVDFLHEHIRPSYSQQFLSQYLLEVLYKRANFISLVCVGIDSPIHLNSSGVSQKTWNTKTSLTSSSGASYKPSQLLTIYAHPLLCQHAAKKPQINDITVCATCAWIHTFKSAGS